MFLYIFWDTPCWIFIWFAMYLCTAKPFWQMGQKKFFWVRSTWCISLKCVLAMEVLVNFLWHFKHMVDPSSKSQSPSSFGSPLQKSISRKNFKSVWYQKLFSSYIWSLSILRHICISIHFLGNSMLDFHVINHVAPNRKYFLTNWT